MCILAFQWNWNEFYSIYFCDQLLPMINSPMTRCKRVIDMVLTHINCTTMAVFQRPLKATHSVVVHLFVIVKVRDLKFFVAITRNIRGYKTPGHWIGCT